MLTGKKRPSVEARRKMSESKKGKKLSPEHRLKLIAILKKNPYRFPKGHTPWNWKGDKAGYVAKHTWIKKHYGYANKCEHCKTETARRYEWANITGKYRRDIKDFKQLCTSCHRKFDRPDYCKSGHFYTKEDVYIDTRGHRVCRTCRKEWLKK